MDSTNPAYRKHLEDRKRRTLIANGAVLDSALSNTLLNIVFLDRPEGISALGDALAAGWPVLIDLGATYGTAFLDAVRSDVGRARLETPPFVTVSTMARLTDAMRWIDLDKVHPAIVDTVRMGMLAMFEQVLFVRFPANAIGLKLGEHCINEQGEVQVFFVPESDPLLSYLTAKYGIRHIEVRSSNITGHPEEPFAPGAVEYACAIAAPIVAVSSLEALEAQMIDQALFKQGLINQMRRKRFGSFPIIRLPQKDESDTAPAITIVRAGNTAPDTVSRMVKGCFPNVEVKYVEEKRGVSRIEYASQHIDPRAIALDLVRATRDTTPEGLEFEE
jgi:hypothetical protein